MGGKYRWKLHELRGLDEAQGYFEDTDDRRRGNFRDARLRSGRLCSGLRPLLHRRRRHWPSRRGCSQARHFDSYDSGHVDCCGFLLASVCSPQRAPRIARECSRRKSSRIQQRLRNRSSLELSPFLDPARDIAQAIFRVKTRLSVGFSRQRFSERRWGGTAEFARAESASAPARLISTLLSVLFVKVRANRHRGCWINGCRVEIDVLDHAVFANHERRPPRKFIFIVRHRVGFHDAVLLQNGAVHVAQQRKRDADLLCECCIGWRTVDADAENHRIACRNLGQIRLIGLEFLRSTTGKRENIEGHDYGLLATEAAERHHRILIAGQREIRSNIADLQCRRGDCRLLVLCVSCKRQRRKRQEQCGRHRNDSLHAPSPWLGLTSNEARIITEARQARLLRIEKPALCSARSIFSQQCQTLDAHRREKMHESSKFTRDNDVYLDSVGFREVS